MIGTNLRIFADGLPNLCGYPKAIRVCYLGHYQALLRHNPMSLIRFIIHNRIIKILRLKIFRLGIILNFGNSGNLEKRKFIYNHIIYKGNNTEFCKE